MKRSKHLDGVKTQNHWQIKPNDPDQLKAALNLGPVGVSINAESYIFRHYTEGVIDWLTCGNEVGHAVLVVGYDTDKETGKEYFIIKNSWGTKWGENGFAKIWNDQSTFVNGICGILSEGYFPEILKES